MKPRKQWRRGLEPSVPGNLKDKIPMTRFSFHMVPAFHKTEVIKSFLGSGIGETKVVR